jgi:hypothetical protein
MKNLVLIFCLFEVSLLQAQTDSSQLIIIDSSQSILKDTSLRFTNLNPYFTQNIDSVLVYQFSINKDPRGYYWYLKNAPVGLSINKDLGIVHFRAAKNYFQSGRLKYDFPYTVEIGVQSLVNPLEKVDSFFTILFYNTEIIPSKVKTSVSGTIFIEEGEELSFRIQCETGSFPIQTLLFSSSIPLRNYTPVLNCGGEFNWTPDFDFVKDTDSAGMRMVVLNFIGSTRFQIKDTATIRVALRNALNYSMAKENFEQLNKNIRSYLLQLKFGFLQL